MTASYKRGETSVMEYHDLMGKALGDFELVSLHEEDMLTLLHKIRFPSFWGSFFKVGMWAEPGAGQKITKVEVTDEGIEFTVIDVHIP